MIRVFSIHPTYAFDEVIAAHELAATLASRKLIHPEIPVYWHPVLTKEEK